MFSVICALYYRAIDCLPRHHVGAIDAKIGKTKIFDNTFFCESFHYKYLMISQLRFEFVFYPVSDGLARLVKALHCAGLQVDFGIKDALNWRT